MAPRRSNLNSRASLTATPRPVQPPDQSGVKVEEFRDAADFLGHLSKPFQADANTYEPRRWVFRGVKDAGFDLSPSALRQNASLMSLESKGWENSSPTTEWDQVRREIYTVHSFFAQADAEGVSLPEDSQQLRAEFNNWIVAKPEAQRAALKEGKLHWPPDNLLSVSGLAQHYGLPTRLLDWTYHPLVACYFAAIGAAVDCSRKEKARLSSDLCVWALSERSITVTDLVADTKRTERNPERAHLVRVTAPTASNANLRAQHGLFILMRPECIRPEDPVKLWDVRKVVQSLVASDEPTLYQWLLPISEAPRLLRLLAHSLVSAASVYPGLMGVVQALQERRFWDPR